jgi:hypothetical protein
MRPASLSIWIACWNNRLKSVSPVAYAEILAGERSGEHDAIESFFESVDCLPIDEAVGRKAGEYCGPTQKALASELPMRWLQPWRTVIKPNCLP